MCVIVVAFLASGAISVKHQRLGTKDVEANVRSAVVVGIICGLALRRLGWRRLIRRSRMNSAQRESCLCEQFTASVLRPHQTKRLCSPISNCVRRFCRSLPRQQYASRYAGRLRLICLCQGAARHYVEHDHGVWDFDLWGFFQEVPGHPRANPVMCLAACSVSGSRIKHFMGRCVSPERRRPICRGYGGSSGIVRHIPLGHRSAMARSGRQPSF